MTQDEEPVPDVPGTPEQAVAAAIRWTGIDDQATEGTWEASPFQDAWLVTRPTTRRGAPLIMVRGGRVRPVHLARETLETARERLVEQES